MALDSLTIRGARLRLAGRALAFAASLYWLGLSLSVFIGRPGGALPPVEGALIGTVLLVAVLLAGRWPALGGALLLVEGLTALGIVALQGGPPVALAVGIPPMLAGWLLLEGQRELQRGRLRSPGEESSA